MLSSYCFYKSLVKFEPNAVSMIKEALPILVEEAAQHGFPHDDSIDRELWGLFSKVADPKYMKKKTPDMPVCTLLMCCMFIYNFCRPIINVASG